MSTGANAAASELRPYPAVFGVRHLSPGVAWHLRAFLNARQPRVVLIEGPADMTPLIGDLVHSKCQPPVAALAYTAEPPVDTLLYPFATYSPEYQALLWASENGAEARFIDLPSSTFLALQGARRRRILAERERRDERVHEDSGEDDDDDGGEDDVVVEAHNEQAPNPFLDEAWTHRSVYRSLAEGAGEHDYESYWEGRFERLGVAERFHEALNELGTTLRELVPDAGLRNAENLVREAYMRREIEASLEAGVAPHEIVVVAGAFHVPALAPTFDPMSDAEVEALPTAPAKLTLMPYSYARLSSQSGYGAGNHAPAYFEAKWQSFRSGTQSEFPALYLSRVARLQRKAGTFRSTAEVIEGSRLAQSLASLHGRDAPVLGELHDAAQTLLGQGSPRPIAEALAQVDIGTSIGALPPGASQTSIQDDFKRELRRLRLEKYCDGKRHEIDLDLRENRRVKSEEAAFLDLHRSTFFQRLAVLKIPFATAHRVDQDSATWAEHWSLEWTPESEIALVEAVLLGETVEVATSFALREQLSAASTATQAARVARVAGTCVLPATLEQARLRIANLAAGSTAFDDLAHACQEVAISVRYGDVRQLDMTPFRPLIEQLFRESTLHLFGSAGCDAATAATYLVAMEELDRVSGEYEELVDHALWVRELRALSASDTRNPLLSGFACALLLQRGDIDEDSLARELSRRLSSGIDAELGAGWFEGVSKRNRYALLSRLSLWRQLEAYIGSLDDEEFKRALVFLRRAFEGFSSVERRQIAENLGELWGLNEDAAADMLEAPLDEEEEAALDELGDFDFGDL